MTELAIPDQVASAALDSQVNYARLVSTADMLPNSYRGKPANVLLAIGLGQSMGLSPAESLYRIAVIQGKPTASAELVAANVRRAGHRLRVTIEPGKATCSIWRSDDPEFEFKVVRDAEWAKAMGLAGNDNYKKQGDTMLSWRAITACARLACPDALYGVVYTPDEMDDIRAPQGQVPRWDAEQEAEAAPPSPDRDVEGQMKAMHASFNEAGITERQDRLDFAMSVVNREIESSTDLTWEERGAVIDALKALPQPQEAGVVS